eukprot:gene22988-29783_t
MPLEPEFVQYLASLNSSEAEFNSLPLVERSSIRRNFSPPAPVQNSSSIISFFRKNGWIAEVGVPHKLVEVPQGDEEFLNRDISMLKFCDVHSNRFEVVSLLEKERHFLTTCMAGPGTGKSRFGQETSKALVNPQFVKNQSLLRLARKNLIVLNITFNGSTKANKDAQYPIEQRLAVRLLLSYFHPLATNPAGLMRKIHSSPLFKNLTVEQALDAILLYHEQSHGKEDLVEHSSKHKGVLHICIDDVAGIVKTTAAVVQPQDCVDLKMMMDILGMLAIEGYSHYFVISIVCGTIFSSVKDVLGSSSHPFVNISLPWLREVDLDVLCQNMLGQDRWQSFSQQESLLIKHRMSEISIPRFVIQALEDLRGMDGSSGVELSITLNYIREKAIKGIDQRLTYSSEIFPRVMREAIYKSFISNAYITEDLVNLENAGWITFESVREESSVYVVENKRVVIPLVVLYCLLSSREYILPRDVLAFVDALKNAGPNLRELEDLVAQYESIKGVAYSQVFALNNSVSLQDYYFGAVVGSAVRDLRMDLSMLPEKLRRSEYRFPETTVRSSVLEAQQTVPLQVDNPKTSFVLQNADGAVIDVLASSPIASSSDGRCLWRAMQMRHSVDQSIAFDIENDVTVWCNQLSRLPNIPSNVSSIVPVFITNRRLRSGSTIDPSKAFKILGDAADCKEVPDNPTTNDTSWRRFVRCSVFITQTSFPKYFGSALGNSLLLALKRISKK